MVPELAEVSQVAWMDPAQQELAFIARSFTSQRGSPPDAGLQCFLLGCPNPGRSLAMLVPPGILFPCTF